MAAAPAKKIDKFTMYLVCR